MSKKTKKDNKKKLIITTLVSILVVILLGVCIYFQFFDKTLRYKIVKHQLDDGSLLIEFRNWSSVPVDIDFKLEYYYKGELDTDELHTISIGAKDTYYFISNNTHNNITFDDYKISSVKISDSEYYDEGLESVKYVSSKVDKNKIKLKVRNDLDYDVDELSYTVAFYDKRNKLVCVREYYDEDLPANKLSTKTIGVPRDDNGKKIKFDHYKVYIQYIFSYID